MLKTFTPPAREGFESDATWGDAYWAARQAYIAEGHSERHEDYCAASDDQGISYAFRVQQTYETHGSSFGSTSSDGLPWFDGVDKAIAYLEGASFPGSVQRCVTNATGEPGWLTAGVAYTKWAGERDYWKARNLMPGLRHWHPDLGQFGPEPVPCTRCDIGRAAAEPTA